MSERKYNQGKWTKARFNSFVAATLRSAKWGPKYDVKKEAFLGKKINVKTGRMCSHYRCASCQNEFPSSEVEVDHIIEVVDPQKGFETWDKYIDRLFCETENLQVLCTTCHKAKTKAAKEKKTSGN